MTEIETQTVENKVEEISKDIVLIQKESESIVIENDDDFKTATEFISKVAARAKRVDELRKFFVNPLKVHVKDIESKFKPQSEFLLSIVKDVKSQISAYHLKKEKEARDEENRLSKLREKRDERREEKGLEPVATPTATVARPEATAKTESGTVTTRKVWKYKVVDIDKVPRSYLRCEVIHARAQTDIDRGVRSIDGLEIYEDIQVSVTAK